MKADAVPRKQLFRWTGWFALANALVLSLISITYFSGLGGKQPVIVWLYLIGNSASHYTLFSLLVLLPVLAPVIVFFPRKRLVLALGVFAIALSIAVLTLDSLLWSQSRFHLNLFTVRILGFQSWAFAFIMFVISLMFEALLARNLWRWVNTATGKPGYLASGLVALCLLASQAIHAWADASYYVPVTATANRLPLNRGITAKQFFKKTGLVDIRQSRERSIARGMTRHLESAEHAGLRYPLNPLQCTQLDRFNLLLIVIDAMRSDMVTPSDMPGIAALAEESFEFRQHYSGGNSSRAGLFSIFYGLPPGYFDSFAGAQRPPVLLQEIQKQNYQLGIFSSSDMYRPAELDRTAFANLPGLRKTISTETEPHWERVRILNEEWLQWVNNLSHDRPFFGFLYYDSTKPGPGYTAPDHLVLDPSRKAFDEYKAAMRANDALVSEVLDDLKQKGLFDQTVVVITADHGDEFDDNGLGFHGHGSAFNQYQLRVPLLVYWPGHPPQIIEHRTNHYSLAPTLMQRLFGCVNSPDDYSVGSNLLSGQSWNWMIAGSYYNYAVLEPDQVTIIFPDGSFEVRDENYALKNNPRFDTAVIEGVIEENRRFHQ